MVKDPVCGMYMDSRLAIRLENQSEAIFFCSEECRKKFLSKSAGGGMDSAAAGQ
jgi:YHS domain-containing protein